MTATLSVVRSFVMSLPMTGEGPLRGVVDAVGQLAGDHARGRC